MSSRFKYRLINGRLTCLCSREWTSANALFETLNTTSYTRGWRTHWISLIIGPCSSAPTSLPASCISSRIDSRMSAHRSVRRRHARRFIYGTTDKRAEIEETGGKVTSTCCRVSHMLRSVRAAGCSPGIGAKPRKSTPIFRISWVISPAVPSTETAADATR